MSEYNYKEGKNRVDSILDNYMEIEEKDKIPKDDDFTFDNGYLSWVTAIFVDIRDSTTLFSNKDEKTAKLIRAFTSELIEILRDDDNLREIGIRGDCVYAIYTTPGKFDEYKCAIKTFYINTFIKMFNKLLMKRGIGTIKVGIGMSTDKELVVKAGRKGVGINSKVWIGKAVTVASKLSAIGDKNRKERLVYSQTSYDNFIDILKSKHPNKNVTNWFSKEWDNNYQAIYVADIIIRDFNDWIENDFS